MKTVNAIGKKVEARFNKVFDLIDQITNPNVPEVSRSHHQGKSRPPRKWKFLKETSIWSGAKQGAA